MLEGRPRGLVATALALAVTLALALGPGAAGSPTAAATSPMVRHCPGRFHHGFFFALRTRAVSCATGRRVLHRWIHHAHFGTQNRRHVHFHGWSCRLRFEGELGKVRCAKHGGRRVWFRGHP